MIVTYERQNIVIVQATGKPKAKKVVCLYLVKPNLILED